MPDAACRSPDSQAQRWLDIFARLQVDPYFSAGCTQCAARRASPERDVAPEAGDGEPSKTERSAASSS